MFLSVRHVFPIPLLLPPLPPPPRHHLFAARQPIPTSSFPNTNPPLPLSPSHVSTSHSPLPPPPPSNPPVPNPPPPTPPHVSPHSSTRTQTFFTRANPFSPFHYHQNPSSFIQFSTLPTMYEPVNIAKTHEILARFRPIAPKPNLPHAQIPAPTPPLHPRVRKRTRTAPPKRQKAPAPPLVERDLLQNLQFPKIISPRPVRPVGSTISVVLMRTGSAGSPPPATPRRLEEVEDDVESDPMPGIVSDCNNRVRMANSAYKELVGQPECMWLDAMVCRRGIGLRPHSRRINGEVALEFCGEAARGLESKEGFCCRVKIEWECDGRKSFVDAACEVVRVYCESRDYLFAWRFYVAEARRTALLSAA